jgi:polysaccharide biosynthesis/export protein
MRKWIFLFLLSTVAMAAAQSTESLLIGPGDMLHVQVLDTPELEEHARVTDAGTIPLLLGDNVNVAGLTPAAAARAVENYWIKEQYMQHPQVLITVDEYATQKVSVLGEVKAPGAFAINTPRTVLEVLTMAGGLTDVAERHLTIERRTTHEKLTYYVSNKAGEALNTAIKVNPGDTLYVPKAGIVYVLGDVKLPGGYTMTNNAAQLTVLELVARAGGTNHSAVPSRARIIHRTADGYQNEPLSLSDMQKGKKPDIALKADDIIYVPFSYMRNFALNASGVAASLGSAAIYRF